MMSMDEQQQLNSSRFVTFSSFRADSNARCLVALHMHMEFNLITCMRNRRYLSCTISKNVLHIHEKGRANDMDKEEIGD